MRLVGHLAAVLDPITEIQIGKGGAAALFDLPQDVVGPETRAGSVGIVESVDRGKPVAQLVDDRNHHELPLSRNSTSRVLTRLCSRKCEYWSRLSWSMPPPECRLA